MSAGVCGPLMGIDQREVKRSHNSERLGLKAPEEKKKKIGHEIKEKKHHEISLL